MHATQTGSYIASYTSADLYSIEWNFLGKGSGKVPTDFLTVNC